MWTLLYQGPGDPVEKTLADWGLSDLKRSRSSVGPHVVTLIADGRAVDALDLFGYGKTVIIYRDREGNSEDGFSGGTRWFYGRVDPWDREGRAGEERHFGEIINPWWYFREKNFEQIWKSWAGWIDGDPRNGPILQDYSNPHIFLNQAIDRPSGKLTVGGQITEVLNWLISEGAPIQIGTIGLPMDVPIDEIPNTLTCEEVMRKMWRWAPDAIFDWDYATLPYPTFYVRQAAALDSLSLDLNAGNELTEVRFKPRPDWQRPFVRIIYEQTNNGVFQPVEDKYPNPLPAEKFAGVVITVPLNGLKSQKQTATINAALIDETNVEWWKARVGWLVDSSIEQASVTLSDFKRESLVQESVYNTALINEALDGSNFPDWLTGKGVTAQRVRVSCKASFRDKVGGQQRDRLLVHEVTATNGSGVYAYLQVDEYAEPIPVGLAQSFYESMQALAIQGQCVTLSEEPRSDLERWKVLNFITPEQPGWATVRALPTTIEDNAREGATMIQFGAPESLGVNDMVALLRVTRGRMIINSFSARTSGTPSGQTNVDLGKKTPTKNTTDGGGYSDKLVVSGWKDAASVPPAGSEGRIVHDAANKMFSMSGAADEGTYSVPLGVAGAVGTTEGRDMAPRWAIFCVTNPDGSKTLKKALVQMSLPEAL